MASTHAPACPGSTGPVPSALEVYQHPWLPGMGTELAGTSPGRPRCLHNSPGSAHRAEAACSPPPGHPRSLTCSPKLLEGSQADPSFPPPENRGGDRGILVVSSPRVGDRTGGRGTVVRRPRSVQEEVIRLWGSPRTLHSRSEALRKKTSAAGLPYR